MAAVVVDVEGRLDEARSLAQAGLELSERIGESYLRAAAASSLARIALDSGGQAEDGRRYAIMALDAVHRLDNLLVSSYAISLWAAAELQLGNVEFRQGDWLAPLHGERFALIASNPPYIAGDDPHLREGDLRFEPASALASGDDGLDAIRAIVAAAPEHLEAGGWLLLEHGWEQGAPVRALLEQAGFVEVARGSTLGLSNRVRPRSPASVSS